MVQVLSRENLGTQYSEGRPRGPGDMFLRSMRVNTFLKAVIEGADLHEFGEVSDSGMHAPVPIRSVR